MLRSTCGKTTKHTIREVKICDSVEVAPIKDTLRENSLWRFGHIQQRLVWADYMTRRVVHAN